MKKIVPFGLMAATLVLSLGGTQPVGAAKLRIKLASIAPENSPWFQHMVKLGEEWEQISGGEVSLVLYPGGQQGDESDVIRKMRIGQLHAGALTVGGLTDLDKNFTVFEIPLFFNSWDELNYVLDDLTPTFKQNLEEAGFVWLTWGHVGWVHFFTTKPVARLDDLRELKIYTSPGNDIMVRWWKRNGFKPVALATTDAVQGLKTGMIETMISPPIAALEFQWFKDAPYMIDVPVLPLVGAFVVTQRVWNRVDEKYRDRLLEAALGVGEKLKKQIPFMDATAVNVMKNRGLTVLEIRDSEHSAEWLEAARKFADQMRGSMVPAAIFDRAKLKRDEYRRAAASRAKSGVAAAAGTTP